VFVSRFIKFLFADAADMRGVVSIHNGLVPCGVVVGFVQAEVWGSSVVG
jgi:hypothetical protein